MFKKRLWKSYILSNVTLPEVFFNHFARKNQLPGLSVSETLVENGLTGYVFHLLIVKFYILLSNYQ